MYKHHIPQGLCSSVSPACLLPTMPPTLLSLPIASPHDAPPGTGQFPSTPVLAHLHHLFQSHVTMPILCRSKARSLFWVSHACAGSQSFGPSSTAFPGHRQGAGREAGLPGLEPAPIWDPGRARRGPLTTCATAPGPPCSSSRIPTHPTQLRCWLTYCC